MGNKIASVFTWFTAFPNYSCITLYKVNTTPKANHMWYTKASRKLIWLNIFEYQGLESCLSDLTRFDTCCEVRLLMDGGRRRRLPLSGHYQIWGVRGAYNTCINTVEFIWRCNAIPILYMCALPWPCNANNASLNQMNLKYFGEVESKHQAHWEWAPLSECALISDDSTYSLNSVGKVIVTVTISRLNFSLTSTTGIWGPLHWVGTIIRGGCVTISDGSTYSLNSVAKVTVIVTILRLKSTTGI